MFEKFINKINNPIGFRILLITKLPAAFFSGLRLKHVDENKCAVTVPFKWFTKNPFKSTYFACLSMAAEMSTGILAMGHIYKRDPAVSMLVTKMEGNFLKKATGTITFISEDGDRVAATINEAIATGKGILLNTYATGKNIDGDTVAEFVFTWSFKIKMPKTIT